MTGGGLKICRCTIFFFSSSLVYVTFFLALHELFFGATACRIFFQTSFPCMIFWGNCYPPTLHPPPVISNGPPVRKVLNFHCLDLRQQKPACADDPNFHVQQEMDSFTQAKATI